MTKNKTNPRRIPRTQADVDRAKAEGIDHATRYWIANTMRTLGDKYGWDKAQLAQFWQEAQSIRESDEWSNITMTQIDEMLKDEYEIIITKKGTRVIPGAFFFCLRMADTGPVSGRGKKSEKQG